MNGCMTVLCIKRTQSIDFSAVVTGLSACAQHAAADPAVDAGTRQCLCIIVVKQLFGGLGQNFMNPALAARCFLMISFAGKMTDFAVDKLSGYHCIDTVTGATALAELKNSGFTADSISVKNLFIGNIHGTIGETSAIAILIGAVILLAFKVIDSRSRLHISEVLQYL